MVHVVKGMFTHAWSGRGQRQAENWVQHKSLHTFTHTRSRSGGGAGPKSAPQQMGPTPNFLRPLRNRALQTICVLNKWQICTRLRSATAPRICERSFIQIHCMDIQWSETPFINSSLPSVAYMNQWIESALVQITACRLFDAKPLSKPMLGYFQWNTYEHITAKF